MYQIPATPSVKAAICEFCKPFARLNASQSQPVPNRGPQDASNEELTRRCESANRYFLDSRLVFGLEGVSFLEGPLILGGLQRGVIPDS
jgi:hypothetical protein